MKVHRELSPNCGPGDQLFAIDHRPVERQAYSTVEDWFAPLAGQKLDVDILRCGQQKHFTITAKELLPMDGLLQLPRNPVYSANRSSESFKKAHRSYRYNLELSIRMSR
jgi:hypothetical protein